MGFNTRQCTGRLPLPQQRMVQPKTSIRKQALLCITWENIHFLEAIWYYSICQSLKCKHLKKHFFLIEVQLIYNVVFVSGVQQSDSVMYIFFCRFFFCKFILLIYFWLRWVFIAVQRLSLVAASGGHSSSRCTGPLTVAASLVAEQIGRAHV